MPDADPKTDLSFVTSDELAEELKRRCDAMVLLVENDRDRKSTAWSCYSTGHTSRLIGMIRRADRRFMEWASQEETVERDDEGEGS